MKLEITNKAPTTALVVGITVALLSGCTTTTQRAQGRSGELAAKDHVVILVPVFIVVPPDDNSSKENSAPPLESLPLRY